MNNFSSDEEDQNKEDLINELIQAHSENIETDQNKTTEETTPQETPDAEETITTIGEVENIQNLIQESDAQTVAPPKTSKKFVVNIQNDYVDYFEDLLPEKRSKLINDFLKNEIDNKGKNRRKKQIARFLRHVLIILLTIVIGFPLIFYIVNSSIQSTLKSYNYMQVNFERLYQQKNLNKF